MPLLTLRGLKNQIEGSVIQTVSRTLIEELKFDRAMVTSLDWASYPILTFTDVPEIVIDLIDRPAERPWGAGEPSAAFVDLQRDLRCNRRAYAFGALYARQNDGSDKCKLIG
jgi:hypothetical protein